MEACAKHASIFMLSNAFNFSIVNDMIVVSNKEGWCQK